MVALHAGSGVLIPYVEEAVTYRQRLQGLLGRAGLGSDHALLIPSCRAVHTVGMRFALDLIFLGRDHHIVRIVRGVQPGCLCIWGGFFARHVLECEAGCVDLSTLTCGMNVRLTPRA